VIAISTFSRTNSVASSASARSFRPATIDISRFRSSVQPKSPGPFCRSGNQWLSGRRRRGTYKSDGRRFLRLLGAGSEWRSRHAANQGAKAVPLLLSEGSTEAIIMKSQAAGKGEDELARLSERLADVSHGSMLSKNPVFRLRCACGCHWSNPICVDFDANWTGPLMDQTPQSVYHAYEMPVAGLLVAGSLVTLILALVLRRSTRSIFGPQA
jgi:hypothetical protein